MAGAHRKFCSKKWQVHPRGPRVRSCALLTRWPEPHFVLATGAGLVLWLVWRWLTFGKVGTASTLGMAPVAVPLCLGGGLTGLAAGNQELGAWLPN